MKKELNNSKKFLLEFFKDSKIQDKKGVLTIEGVSKDFENFTGKKAPYIFVFDINLHNKVKDSELIMQGSYFLLAIRDYLQDMGQTSLLKINIKPESIELNKKYKILETKIANFEAFHEFSFLSLYQYLNNKKQSLNKILVKNNVVLDLKMSKFKFQKGNKNEVKFSDSLRPYQIAKKVLEKKVNQDTKTIKQTLKVKLGKELFRVKDHYLKQIKEKDEEVESCANKIKMLQGKLRHTSYERDINILKRMIRESQERLEMLKKKSYKERLHTEEKFHINDEVEKHVLSIKNKLINCTVYYYPIFELKVSVKGKKSFLRYDPILEKII